jgi:hypothetical protein
MNKKRVKVQDETSSGPETQGETPDNPEVQDETPSGPEVVTVALAWHKRLNVRAEPSRVSELVGRLDNGTAVEVLARDGDWVKIESGWILAQYTK